MIVETGHYALVLALALALIQSVLPLWGVRRRDAALTATAAPAALGQFVLVAYSFAALTYAHVVSDFSLINVVRELPFDEAPDLQDLAASGGTTKDRCSSGC